MTERELKAKIFKQHPDLQTVRPIGWREPCDIPTSDAIGVAIFAPERFDGWYHLPVRDEALRELARRWLTNNHPDRRCDAGDDSVLVLVRVQ